MGGGGSGGEGFEGGHFLGAFFRCPRPRVVDTSHASRAHDFTYAFSIAISSQRSYDERLFFENTNMNDYLYEVS